MARPAVGDRRADDHHPLDDLADVGWDTPGVAPRRPREALSSRPRSDHLPEATDRGKIAIRVEASLAAVPKPAVAEGARIQTAAAALRHVPEPRRAALLDGMPTPKAVACRMLLGYPGASVGAWVDSDIIVFGRDTRVDEAITRLAGEQAADTADGIYLVDPANRLMGIVPLGALFRAPAHLRLMGLMRPAPASLPSAMPVTAALGLRAWDEALSLPVIDIRDRLVGRVQRALLFTTTARSPGRGGEGGTLIEVLGSTYWAVVSGLLAAAVSRAEMSPACPSA